MADVLVGRGVRRPAPTLFDLITGPATAAQSALGAMGSAAKGAAQATVGLPGDIESLVRMITGGEQKLPTTEEVGQFVNQYIRAPYSQYERLGEFTGLPVAGALNRPVTQITNEAADALVRAITGNPQATAPAVLEAAGGMVPLSRIVKPEMISSLKELTMSPVDDVIKQAIQNTPGAKLTETGLELPVTRYQRPVQGGRESSRSGVFYGIGDKAEIFKGVKDDMPGGTQMVSGVTKVQNPFFASGTDYSGSWADAFMKLNPEKAETITYEVENLFAKNPSKWEGLIEDFYKKYAPNEKFDAKRIIKSNPNQQQLMLIESALANELKQQGYDSMIGMYGAGTKTFRGTTINENAPPTMFELFDVREATYPKKSGATTIRPEFLKEEQIKSAVSDPAFAGLLEPQAATRGFNVVQPGDKVSGLTVRKDVPNMSSISASLDDYEILSGIREVPRSAFDEEYLGSLSYDKLDKRTKDLVEQIKQSKEINPMIVGVDSKGAYIIEGGHRFDALMSQDTKSIPAVVVIDKSDPPTDIGSLLD